MDVSKLTTGEKIAGVAGVLLLLIMFIFDWFSYDVGGGFADVSAGGNAWDTMELIRWILLLAALAGIALAIVGAQATQPNMPVALSAITAGLGILGVIFVIIRIISPPDQGLGDLVDASRSIGVFLGLIAVAGVAYGGWTAMQEEGTSFGDQADRFGGGGGSEAPPPPPAPPSGGGPAA
jgi:hypothetical protein